VEMDVVARKGFNRIGLDGTEHCEKKSFNSLARQKKNGPRNWDRDWRKTEQVDERWKTPQPIVCIIDGQMSFPFLVLPFVCSRYTFLFVLLTSRVVPANFLLSQKSKKLQHHLLQSHSDYSDRYRSRRRKGGEKTSQTHTPTQSQLEKENPRTMTKRRPYIICMCVRKKTKGKSSILHIYSARKRSSSSSSSNTAAPLIFSFPS